jgi:hypothetical protein
MVTYSIYLERGRREFIESSRSACDMWRGGGGKEEEENK